MDVGGITRNDRVSKELSSGSLRQAVGILTPEDFRPVSTVSKVSGPDSFKPCHFECDGTEEFKQVYALAW